MLKLAPYLIAISSIFIYVSCKMPGKIAGPANLIFTTFEHCDPPQVGVDVWVSQRKYNRSTNVLDISLTTPWPLGDDVTLELKGYMKKEGGYKPGSFYLKDTFCVVMKSMFNDVFTAFMDVAGVQDCPIPEGEYKFKDFYIDNNKLPSQLMYGEHKTEAVIIINGESKACYLIYLELVPREE